MLCSLLMLLALGTLRLIGAANVGAQQSRPTSAGGVKFAAPAAARKSTRPPVATTRRATAGTQAMSYRGEAAAAGTINADGSISPPGSADGQGQDSYAVAPDMAVKTGSGKKTDICHGQTAGTNLKSGRRQQVV